MKRLRLIGDSFERLFDARVTEMMGKWKKRRKSTLRGLYFIKGGSCLGQSRNKLGLGLVSEHEVTRTCYVTGLFPIPPSLFSILHSPFTIRHSSFTQSTLLVPCTPSSLLRAPSAGFAAGKGGKQEKGSGGWLHATMLIMPIMQIMRRESRFA